MREVFATHQQLAARVAARPRGYAEALARAEVRRDGGGVTYDADHAGWAEAAAMSAVPPRPVLQPLTVGQVIHGAAGIAKALTGTGGASDELVATRLAVCNACPHAEKFLGMLQRCGLCGCSTWAKIRNADERCPAGKW